MHIYVVSFDFKGDVNGNGSREIELNEKWRKGTHFEVVNKLIDELTRLYGEVRTLSITSIFYVGEYKKGEPC